MRCGSSKNNWKPCRWKRLDLKMRDTYINYNLNQFTKFTGRAVEALSLKLSSHEHLSTRIAISYAKKQDMPLWVLQKVNGNWQESHCRTNTTVRRKKINSKEQDFGVTVKDLSRLVSHLSKIEKLWQSSPGLSLPPE